MDLRHKVHFINFCRKMAFNAVFFLIPLHFLKVGFNGWQIGMIVSLYAFMPLLVTVPTGWVNDRLAIAQVIRGALLVNGLVFVGLSLTQDYFLTALLIAVFAAANSILDVSTNNLYYKDEREDNLNRKFGMLGFWLNLGTSLGTILGGVLIFFSGFRVMFYALAGLMVVTFLAVRRFGNEKFEMIPLREYRLSFFRRKTLLLTLMLFILALHWGVEGTVYSPFLREAFKLNSFQVALYIGLALFVMALAALWVSRREFDPVFNRRLFLTGMFMSGLGLMLMTVPNVYFSFLARAAHETGDGLMGALVTIFISRLFERRNIGGNAGLLMGAFTLGSMVGAQLFSPLGYSLGLQFPFLITGALLVLDCGFGYIVFKKVAY